MSEHFRKNPSYLIKHRNKWQVRLAIPKDVQWAFNSKKIFKRSTGCALGDVEAAKTARDKIVKKFKSIVDLHRSASSVETDLHKNLRSGFVKRPFPPRMLEKTEINTDIQSSGQQILSQDDNYPEKFQKLTRYSEDGKNIDKGLQDTNVNDWIKERLLKKSQQGKILRYDFWGEEKK